VIEQLFGLAVVDGVYLLRRERTFMNVNAAGCASLGYTGEDALGLNVLDVQDGKAWNDLWDSLTWGDTATVETVARRKDGTCFPVEVHITPVRCDAEVVMLALVRDVTAHHEAEAELGRRTEQQAVLAELGRRAMTGVDAAALIRDAVDAVVGVLGVESAEVLGADFGAGEVSSASGTIATFEHGSGRVGTLAVHAPPARTFKPNELHFVQGVANIIGAGVVREREEQLRAEVEPLRHLQVIAGETAHDLKNLLGVVVTCAEFAIEAAPDESELRADLMEITHAAERATTVVASLELDTTNAAFVDVGIAPTTNDVRVPVGPRVDLRREWSEDVRPVETSSGHRVRKRALTPRGHGETILVVEDHEAVRRLTMRILSDSGYEILTAASFEAAATLWEAHRTTIDLLLTDVDLGKRSGADLANIIWQTAPELPVLFMSGDADDEALLGGEDRRTAVVEKPLSSESLLRGVCAVLKGRF
jgi:PAS domain S-box-containing protein